LNETKGAPRRSRVPPGEGRQRTLDTLDLIRLELVIVYEKMIEHKKRIKFVKPIGKSGKST